MRLYRRCRQKYAELTGYGAKRTGGRWNRKGIAALYTAEYASLAVVEVLVHLDRTEVPVDFVLLEVTVPDEHIFPVVAPASGESFLRAVYDSGAAALPKGMIGFSIPSVVVPQDRNVILYPDAPLHEAVVRVGTINPFAFDRRLFSRLQ